MDAEDRRLFEDALRKITETSTGAALDQALAELGWTEALAEEPQTAVSLLFELQGTANATSGALDAVLASALGIDLESATIAMPALGTARPPGEVVDGRLVVRGLARQSSAHSLVIVAEPAGAVAAVDRSAVTERPISGMDPDLGLVEVTGELPNGPDRALALDPPGLWETAVAGGQIAVAHEIVGSCRTMLRLAREHALEREQFGKKISQFQAIRHRLAEGLVAIEAADAALAAAWEDGSPLAARFAKAIAGQSAKTVARHAQQVLAGMGFTAEHDFHRYLRRALMLDQLLGSSKTLTRQIGEELIQARALPPMLPL